MSGVPRQGGVVTPQQIQARGAHRSPPLQGGRPTSYKIRVGNEYFTVGGFAIALASNPSRIHELPGVPLARPDRLPTRGVPVATPPLDGLLAMARMAGGIDVDHPPAPSGLGEDPRSHCADDPELVDPAAKRRKDERLHGLTVPARGPGSVCRRLGAPVGVPPCRR